MIERKIVIGMITNTQFLKEIEGEWKPIYMESAVAKLLSVWCIEYYQKYKKAPKQDIETIFIKKLKEGLDDEIANEIEEEILPSLSEEYENDGEPTFLLEEACNHFIERQITLHNEKVSDYLQAGKVVEAKKEIDEFKIKTKVTSTGLDLSKKETLENVGKAFDESFQSVIKFPGALGHFLNDDLVHGGLVGILAPEKRGKCLPGTQLVLTSTGEYITINQLIKQNRRDIISYDEKNEQFVKTNIQQFWINGIKPVYEVKTKTGRKVQITKNHPFLTPDGWKDLTEIGKGAFIAVPKEISIFGDRQIPKTIVKLLAYFIADGCLREYKNEKRKTIVIRYAKNEPSMKMDFENCINKMGCSVRWIDETNCSIINSKKNRGLHGKNYVLEMLRKYKIWNKLSIEKNIPIEIFKANKETISLFLRTLYSGDGWVNKDGSEIGYASANKVLAKQVQMLLTKFGIVSLLCEKKNDKNGAWAVTIRDYENIVRFKEQIGFVFSKHEKLIKSLIEKTVSYKSFLDKFPHQIAQKFHDEVKEELGYSLFLKQFTKAGTVRESLVKKQPLMRQSFLQVKETKTGKKYFNSSILWDEITDICFIGNKKTYDLTVENHHNFIAENILVHNTFTLLELMMTAYKQDKKVAFFQAGDMTENQQLIRIGIYLAQKSNKEKYCGTRYIAVQDCIHNQKDTCTKNVRECNFGLFGEEIESRDEITMEQLIIAFEENPEYKPCYNCTQWEKSNWGTPWVRKVHIKEPLTKKEATVKWKRFFIRAGRSIKLSTHANLTLKVKDIEAILDKWKEEEDFVPDLILIDYADILAPEIKGTFREQENHKWMRLRALAQRENEPLVIVPTQADAASYKQETMGMFNFSEDKRKNAHVTALIGLNQDPKGREKEIGIMRFNKIVLREGDITGQVYVLQHLAIGRPFLGSYY